MVALKSEESRINAQIVHLTHAYELVLFVYCFASEITAPKFIFFILQNLFFSPLSFISAKNVKHGVC